MFILTYMHTKRNREQLIAKEALLRDILTAYGRVAVAFSGGADSALLVDVAHELCGEDLLAVTACCKGLAKREQQAARDFCNKRKIRHLEVAFDEFAILGFADNLPNRCYLCKRELLSTLMQATKTAGCSTLVEGSILDDENDYRPGLLAIAELGVVSPLRLAGFSKADVRALSKERELPTWDKPSCACLATRLPYGTRITPELIERIDLAEEFLLDLGVKQVRVRVHNNLARVELDEESMAYLAHHTLFQRIDFHLRELGFSYVTLDLGGYRSGSMNTVLAKPSCNKTPQDLP